MLWRSESVSLIGWIAAICVDTIHHDQHNITTDYRRDTQTLSSMNWYGLAMDYW